MMEQMPWVIATLMTVLLVAISGIYLAVRITGARTAGHDHPVRHTPAPPAPLGAVSGQSVPTARKNRTISADASGPAGSV